MTTGQFSIVGQLVKLRAGCQPALQAGCQPAAGFHPAPQSFTPGGPMATSAPKQLPANAYTPLPPGTVYQPPVAASENLAELTPRSIGWGLFLCVVFTVASAYSGLKVGQVLEAEIP